MDDIHYINPLWRLADPLTVKQAAVLIAGLDPNKISFRADGSAYFHEEHDDKRVAWVDTALAALTNAINGGNLKAKVTTPPLKSFKKYLTGFLM